jgi:hypothetical protein
MCSSPLKNHNLTVPLEDQKKSLFSILFSYLIFFLLIMLPLFFKVPSTRDAMKQVCGSSKLELAQLRLLEVDNRVLLLMKKPSIPFIASTAKASHSAAPGTAEESGVDDSGGLYRSGLFYYFSVTSATEKPFSS